MRRVTGGALQLLLRMILSMLQKFQVLPACEFSRGTISTSCTGSY
jgi:hypothetical protein